MRNRKYSNRKKIKYFAVTFLSTFLIGAVVLVVYAQFLKNSKPAMGEGLEIIQTDNESMEKPDQTDAGNDFGSDTRPEGQIENSTDGGGEISTDVQEGEEIPQESPGQVKTVTIAFGGDICFHDEYANMYALSNRGGEIDSCISEELLAEMRQADLCMVNNEFPYSDRGTPIPEKAFAFRSKPENVELLHDMGVDLVSLANNHAYDHGEEAFLDTLSVLEEAGVKYVGAGRNLEEASEASYYDINGVTIGILAGTQIERLENPDTKGATENSPGVLRCFTESELNHFLEVITETKKQCDVLVVYMHWGTENTEELDWAQPYQADLISKAGADLIVGAHPHCLQGMDVVNGVPVIYSLGNYWFNSKTMDTALLKVTVQDGKVETVQIIPARQEDCRTTMLKEGEKQRVLEYLRSLSSDVDIDDAGYLKW